MTNRDHNQDTPSSIDDLENIEKLDDAARKVLELAEHRVLIAAPRLRLPIFLRPSVRDLLRHLLIGHRDNEIRILIDDERHFMRVNSTLADVARGHPSRVTVRCMPTDLDLAEELIVAADNLHAFHQPDMNHETGQIILNDRGSTQALLERIRPWWDRAERPAELFTAGL